MSSIDEKRIHGANTDAATLFVASDIGLVRVTVAGERVGEIELVDRRAAHDLATFETRLAVATDDDVLVLAGNSIEATGFGPATAVGFTDTLLTADPDGTIARRAADDWTKFGKIEPVRAIDGNLLGTDGGIYRLVENELQYAGLETVRDVVTGDTPYAATATGLYRLGNGWMDALDGDSEMVAAGERAHAATADRFYEYDGEWRPIKETDRTIVGVAYAGGVYAVCADGTLLVETTDGWREHPLGVTKAHAVVRTDRNSV